MTPLHIWDAPRIGRVDDFGNGVVTKTYARVVLEADALALAARLAEAERLLRLADQTVALGVCTEADHGCDLQAAVTAWLAGAPTSAGGSDNGG